MSDEPAKVLTVAGSDSGGAAGLQADLKTWTALGVYGMSVVTAVTAQNSVQVDEVHYLPPNLVSAQLKAVLSDYGASAIKTGFIGRAELVKIIAQGLKEFAPFHLVIDPVLVNHKGQPMFGQDVVRAYRDYLLPQADLITPNWDEAQLLAGLPREKMHSLSALKRAAAAVHTLGSKNVLISGIRSGDEIVDYWSDGNKLHALTGPIIETENVHGSGDTLSATICAFLASGDSMGDAIKKARQFTVKALQRAANWRLGKGHGPLSHFTY
jgi:hydroxymethylpyrimidine/phosphomethylpyrimidine kinase